ncbi:MAG: LON peptidase substrate-binding domain-containing protein [Opitutales bacterium]|nr:LON peptidase substrate-binding domain-containing protein [Opitutales bacterium]
MQRIEIPETIPAMMLSETVFFPQSILPLYIFEHHYRKMLQQVVEGDRMFTIVSPANERSSDPLLAQTPEIVTVGFVKACQTYEDGTSTVLLEGIVRARVEEYVRHFPYPVLRVTSLEDYPHDGDKLFSLKSKTLQLIESIHHQGGEVSEDLIHHLKQIDLPEHFVDHATASCVQNSAEKMRILKCTNPVQRYESLLHRLQTELYHIKLLNEIKGDLSVDQIRNN